MGLALDFAFSEFFAVSLTSGFDGFVIDAYLVMVLVGFVAIDGFAAHFECLKGAVAAVVAPDGDPYCAHAIDFADELVVAFRKILLLHFHGDLYHFRLCDG